jgi:hypothetical protein
VTSQIGPTFSVINTRPSGTNARRHGRLKVATVVMTNGKLASGLCAPRLVWADAPVAVKVASTAVFASLIFHLPRTRAMPPVYSSGGAGRGWRTARPSPSPRRGAVRGCKGFACGRKETAAFPRRAAWAVGLCDSWETDGIQLKSKIAFRRRLGKNVRVISAAQRTLTPLILVRIQVPQPTTGY